MSIYLVPFWCSTYSFWHVLVSCIVLGHFHLVILPFKYFYGAKCLIYINLCTFHVKENSARLQWYSCARYKAPGPLVWILDHTCSWTVSSSLYSPSTTRPPSPKSDTEVDRQKNAEVDQSILTEEDNTLWEWGDLPRKSISSDTPIAFPDNSQGKMGAGGTCKLGE